MTTPPTTRPALSRTCLPATGPITDAHLARLFAPIPPIEPADPPMQRRDGLIWIALFTVMGLEFAALLYGPYRLIF